MPVSGLVVTLSSDEALRRQALEGLRGHAALELGDLQGHRLPVALDTPDSETNREVWHWLHTLPGVMFVDLVCADSSSDQDACMEAPVPGERT